MRKPASSGLLLRLEILEDRLLLSQAGSLEPSPAAPVTTAVTAPVMPGASQQGSSQNTAAHSPSGGNYGSSGSGSAASYPTSTGSTGYHHYPSSTTDDQTSNKGMDEYSRDQTASGAMQSPSRYQKDADASPRTPANRIQIPVAPSNFQAAVAALQSAEQSSPGLAVQSSQSFLAIGPTPGMDRTVTLTGPSLAGTRLPAETRGQVNPAVQAEPGGVWQPFPPLATSPEEQAGGMEFSEAMVGEPPGDLLDLPMQKGVVLAGSLPADWSRLESGAEQFLVRLGNLGQDPSSVPLLLRLAPWLAFVAVAPLTFEVVRWGLKKQQPRRQGLLPPRGDPRSSTFLDLFDLALREDP